MDQTGDTNAAIWKSEDVVRTWAAEADERERKHAPQWRLMGQLLPFADQDEFTFLDLGAGTGAAARSVLTQFPRSSAILADYSTQMMREGEPRMQPFAGRYRYVEFDMGTGQWPEAIGSGLDAVITSLCIHHLPDERKQSVFAEIFEHLAPGAWYLNYDPITSTDPVVAAAWQRANDRADPQAAHKRAHRSEQEEARYANHVRYMIPLAPQLQYLRAAGFTAVDVYWKRLDEVVYGGHRPA
jgi:ubiquinone/menaquinone biosynthesis C-methylase UbiE